MKPFPTALVSRGTGRMLRSAGCQSGAAEMGCVALAKVPEAHAAIWFVVMMRFSVPHHGVERYQDTKRCGYEARDEDESAFHSKSLA
jgi:hypothetical protein